MADATTASRLLRRLRARVGQVQPDFGDHGTAFGLELSMAPQPAPGPAAAPVRDARWWRRLSARRATTR
jgi:hypothetical protein